MDHRRHRDAVDAEASTWRELDARQHAVVDTSGPVGIHHTRAVAECGVLAARLQQEVALEAARQVMRSTDSWTMAARRVEALARLGDRLAEQEHDEEQRRVANEVDDMVLARFTRQLGSRS